MVQRPESMGCEVEKQESTQAAGACVLCSGW
jgi:hypothetical protein